MAKYELERELGEGQFGVTYLAKDTVTEELVALKVLKHPQLALDDFRDEVKALMQFNHPNIIRYKDCNYFDATPAQRLFYLATEFADGGNLEGRAGRITLATAVDHVIQILTGLAECHRQHRLHADIRPANIFVTRGTVKIGDFGVSMESTNTVAGPILGTPSYWPRKSTRLTFVLRSGQICGRWA